MFIRYQNVRNTVLGIVTVGAASLAYFFLGRDDPKTTPPPPASTTQLAQHDTPVAKTPASVSDTPTAEFLATDFPGERSPAAVTERTGNPNEDRRIADTQIRPPAKIHTPSPPEPALSPQEVRAARYRSAMKVATGPSDPSGKGKDVLGPQSPWKLNLYDDDRDGQWDRSKLDYDRDEKDDEHWTYKKGRWEKDGGSTIWDGTNWVASATSTQPVTSDSKAANRADPQLAQYRAAMKIATGRSDSSGKGKDVLGPQSPWKLNLYDDDKDGQWDRGKLDYDRDENDDEHWTYKKGRWEKDGGSTIWDGTNWVTSATSTQPVSSDSKTANRADPQLARYQAAMKIATSRSDPSGKGKDVLGPRSPWKLNLYDDDKDGKWDRGKLDYDRDEEDDEKWNFKHGRWEKEGGKMIWEGGQWIASEKNG